MSQLMSRKLSMFVAAVAFATTPTLFAAEPVAASATEPTSTSDCAREESSQHAVTLAQLFANAAKEETIDVVEGVASGNAPMEVVMARIDTDGKVVMSCVDTEEAAKRFLAAPVEKLVSKKAKEQ